MFEAAPWTGTVGHDDQTKSWKFCSVFTDYRESQERLGFIANTAGFGLLYQHQKGFKPGLQYDVRLSVDGRTIYDGKAGSTPDRLIYIPVAVSPQVLKHLRHGHLLTVATPQGAAKFGLTGSYTALEGLATCLANYAPPHHRPFSPNVPPEHQPNAPKAPPSPSQPPVKPDFEYVPQAELVVLVTNLLNKAGASFRLLPLRSDTPMVSFELQDGTLGSAIAARGRTATADEYVAQRTAALSRECKGDAATAKRNVPSTDGSVRRGLLVTCRTPSGEAEVIDVDVRRQPSGLLMDFTFRWTTKDETAPAAPRPDRERLQKTSDL